MSWFHGATIQNPMLNGSGPGFTRYTRNEFDKLRRQHNIMVLVGNGFDIQVLQDYNRHVDSRYETFYHYLKMRGFDPANVLVQHMDAELQLHQRTGGHGDWSDVEAALASTLASGAHAVDALLTDLRAIQAAFAQFLQMVAPSELLEQLGADAAECKWSHTSLAEFLADVTDRNAYLTMQFPKRVDHYDLFNFQFMNFNYTTLLDDYVYLDPKQFDPFRHSTVDTNFLFKNDPNTHLNPGGKVDYGYSTYLLTDVVHPHGILSTPRSVLFGIDAEDDYKKHRDPAHRLKKAYWSQAHALYRGCFAQTDLFIIFGCSLGESDGWWWRNIVECLRQPKHQSRSESQADGQSEILTEEAELIIYWWQRSGEHTAETVKDRFFKAAGLLDSDPDRHALADRVRVVLYDDATPRVFLNSRRSSASP